MPNTPIIVNGRKLLVGVSYLTFGDLIWLGEGQYTDTVTVHYPDGEALDRAPRMGDDVIVYPGMVVNVVDTGNA